MYRVIKRVADILLAAILIVILSPLLVPIMIALKLTGEYYIFYLQERVGYQNRPFDIYKFATMLKDSPNMAGGIITTNKDPRILPFGGFLRRTKINELPQVFNILFGQMSFVGPRPLMKKSFDTYTQEVQQVVYQSKPGLTGIGSIVFRDEEELLTAIKNKGQDTWAFYSTVIYPHKGKLEQWYQANKSLWTDFKILVATAVVVINDKSDIAHTLFKDLPKRNF